MKLKNKIKIKLNGKNIYIKSNITVKDLLTKLKIPIKMVAIELNKKILDKTKIKKKLIKKNDSIEIVHFIGGG
tara:strand:+ start:85 stop:303 length:219 start_codon:yes stop_codon:yes gene_type:complete